MKLVRHNITIEGYLCLFIVISLGFTGIISYFAMLSDNRILKLWKEAFVGLFSVYVLITMYRRRITYTTIYSLLVLIGGYVFYIIYNISIGIPTELIFYQCKNDLIVWVFAVCLYAFLQGMSDSEVYICAAKILNIVIGLGALNAICGIIQVLFPMLFLDILGFNGAWGAGQGVMLFWSNGTIRPIGLQMGFVPYATLCFFCFVIIWHNHILDYANKKKYSLLGLFGIAIVLSNYYTATVGFFIFLVLMFICFVLRHKLHYSYREFLLVAFVVHILIFSIFAYTTNAYDVYEWVANYSPDKAYTSIYGRVLAHLSIMESVTKNLDTIVFGVGFGVNGAYDLFKSSLLAVVGGFATDSSYSYLLSNYGLTGIVLFVAAALYWIDVNSKKDRLGVTYLLLYLLTVDFFFNNIFSNFPLNFLIIYLVTLNMRLLKVDIASLPGSGDHHAKIKIHDHE